MPLFNITGIVAEDQASPLFNGDAHLTFVDETFSLIYGLMSRSAMSESLEQ